MNQENQELILKILLLEMDFQDLWYEHFIDILPNYQINNSLRICHFFAQIMHETLNLSCLEENFNYSKDNLIKIFPKYFNKNNITKYLENDRKIANKIYANRMGNSTEESEDGYKFRGRGIIQTTGKENYRKLNNFLKEKYSDININLMDNPDYLIKDKKISIISGCFFWQEKNLNKYADRDDLISIRKKINGGLIGLDDCINRLEMYKMFLDFN